MGMGDSPGAVVNRRVLSLRSLTEVIVALQGTIETFALPDVMRLLASTKKTGSVMRRSCSGDAAGSAAAGHYSGNAHRPLAVALMTGWSSKLQTIGR